MLAAMPVVFRARGLRFFFYSNEGSPREPVHVHVLGAEGEAKFWLRPARVASNDGFDARDLRELARLVDDRTDGDTLILTHELISLMLGVTRPGVTIAAGALQKAGLIQYTRGRLTIVDRVGLEQTACECYRTVANYYRSALG